MERSTQGAQALFAAAAKAIHEPERAAYLVAAGSNITASFFGWKSWKKITKPALMPLLAGRVLRSDAPDNALGVVGLAGGWAGDLALLKPDNIPAGATGFALNHAAYVYLLTARGARPNPGRVAIRAVPLGAATALAAWKAPKLLPVVLCYGGVLVATSTLADDSVLIDPATPASYGLGHGGNLFLISDVVLFARDILLEEGTVASHVADAIVMGTYTVAQLLLIDGLFPTSARG